MSKFLQHTPDGFISHYIKNAVNKREWQETEKIFSKGKLALLPSPHAAVFY